MATEEERPCLVYVNIRNENGELLKVERLWLTETERRDLIQGTSEIKVDVYKVSFKNAN